MYCQPMATALATSPVREARTRIHRTIAEAAESAGVNWQTWYLTEAGCYEHIPPAILHFIVGQGVGELSQENYTRFRERKQREFGSSHNQALQTLPPVCVSSSPLESLWKAVGVSRSEFAKSLCIQPAHLYRLQRGQAKELPASVIQALLTAGVPQDIVEELNERQQEFYEFNG